MEGYRYVDSTWAYKPTKPVIDDEPIYEGIPKGLHNPNEGIWQACDVRPLCLLECVCRQLRAHLWP